MELSTITMDRQKARQAFLEYRRAIRTAEDERIMRAYRELYRGKQLLRLFETIAAAGLVERIDRQGGKRHLPALAIVRADQPECRVAVGVNGDAVFAPTRDILSNRPRSPLSLSIRCPDGTFGLDENRNRWIHAEFRAMAPLIPPALRPPHHLRNYHLLWEADWQLVPRPPRDPALLKHIGGDLYAVVAVWDLTEVERAVLAGRSIQA